MTSNVSFKQSIYPLFIISKFTGTWPFSLYPLKVSVLGTLLSVGTITGYSIYHIIAAARNTAVSKTNTISFITIIIESFNRYSGLFCVVVLSCTMNINQRNMVRALEVIEEVDREFASVITYPIDNTNIRRYVKRCI